MARVSRTKEERIADIDSKIEFCQKKISAYTIKVKQLEDNKKEIENPTQKHRKNTMGNLVKKAKESGLSVEDMAVKLGIEL